MKTHEKLVFTTYFHSVICRRAAYWKQSFWYITMGWVEMVDVKSQKYKSDLHCIASCWWLSYYSNSYRYLVPWWQNQGRRVVGRTILLPWRFYCCYYCWLLLAAAAVTTIPDNRQLDNENFSDWISTRDKIIRNFPHPTLHHHHQTTTFISLVWTSFPKDEWRTSSSGNRALLQPPSCWLITTTHNIFYVLVLQQKRLKLSNNCTERVDKMNIIGTLTLTRNGQKLSLLNSTCLPNPSGTSW